MDDNPKPFTLGNRFQELFGQPPPHVVSKAVRELGPWLSAFIRHSPFLVIATFNAEGWCSASPRGGAPGFVQIRDSRTLLIPDYPGNNLFQSNSNVEANGKAGLLFMIPGVNETARVVGSARVAPSADFADTLSVEPNSLVRQWLVVHIDHAYYHCGRAIKTANLWDVDRIRAARAEPPVTKRPERNKD